MTAEKFMATFGHVADAPHGIEKLRKLVLKLAVRGGLVPQDSKDKLADLLLEEGFSEGNGLSSLNDSEVPFRIPSSWIWTKFDSIVDFSIGRTPPTKNSAYWTDEGTPWVSIADMPASGVITSTSKTVSEEAREEIFKTPPTPKGTLLMSFKLSIGKVAFLKFDAYHNEAIISIYPHVDAIKNYLHVCLRGINLLTDSADAIKGKTLNKTSLKAIQVPLPPLAEQKRIVAKVDELLGLIDDLEAKQEARKKVRMRLNTAALHHLTKAETPKALRKHWTRIKDRFQLLYDTPETVQALRQTILQLAVQGKLLGQSAALSIVGSTVGDFVKIQNGYAFKSTWFEQSGIRLVRNANVGHGTLRWTDVARVSTKRAAEYERFSLEYGDIVISLDRPLISTGLKVARITEEDLPSLLLQRVGRAHIKDNRLLPEFFFLWINSPLFVNAIDPGRSNGVPHISSREIESLALTLPTKDEQKRIVAKVDELMALCDALESRLTHAQDHARHLTNAIVHHLIEPAA